MDSRQGREEEACPLVIVEDETGSSSPSQPPKSYTRDIHILSIACLFIFSAYHAAQNLESTVNTEGGLGTTSMGILYVSFALFSILASPLVRGLGSKRALVLGTSGYLFFIAANLIPSWYMMVPASVYLGFSASIFWVGQGTYLTSAARQHAKDCHRHEGMTIGSFNGEFYGFFATTQVIGNLISLALLRDGQEGGSVTGKNLLFTTFLGIMLLGIILMCFLSRRHDKEEGPPMYPSVASKLKSIIAPLMGTQLLLIIPLLAYSGLEQAFAWSVFTKKVVTPALGISGVGGAMALYGAADAICSLVVGRLTSGMSSITLIVFGGAFLQMLVLLWLLCGYSLTSGLPGTVYTLLMAITWGVGDGVFITQLSVLLGILFKHDTEAAFAQLKVWQCAATAAVFFLGPYISFQAMLIVMIAGLCIAMCGFLLLALTVRKSSSPES